MLRIERTRTPETIDLGDGAALHLRQPDVADIVIARTAAADTLLDLEDDDRGAAFRATFARKLLSRCLTSWEGIGDADGNAIEPSPDAVESLLAIPRVFDLVETKLVLPIFLRSEEKNASSPSLNGTSPGALKGEPGAAADAPIARNA